MRLRGDGREGRRRPRSSIKERNGETMTLALADNFTVSEVLPIDPAAIQPGTFVGTAAMPGTGRHARRARGAGLPPRRRAAPAKAIRPGTCSPGRR